MTLYIRLNKNINPNKILHDIQQEIKKHRKDEGDLLKIEVKHATEVVEEITREQVSRHLEDRSSD